MTLGYIYLIDYPVGLVRGLPYGIMRNDEPRKGVPSGWATDTPPLYE